MVGQAPLKLVVTDVTKRFKTPTGIVHALDKVSLSVYEGEFVCLIGPSGCGKSTLLNLIAGLDMPGEGTITADGNRVTGPGSDRMMMFQENALFPWLNVIGNVMFGLRFVTGITTKDRRKVAESYLVMVGLEKFIEADIHGLSGGMKQRVALARCLAPDPRVLLMDEPFAALDALTREQLYRDIQTIMAKQKKTIVFVTHNVREAICLADRVVLFSPHPGRIHEHFQIDLPRPRDINSIESAEYSVRINAALKRYLVEGGAR